MDTHKRNQDGDEIRERRVDGEVGGGAGVVQEEINHEGAQRHTKVQNLRKNHGDTMIFVYRDRWYSDPTGSGSRWQVGPRSEEIREYPQ
jgi:hypothetical protein